MRQSFYLRQRKSDGLFSVIFIDPLTEKRTERATGTNDEKKANAIAQGWLANGLPENPTVNKIAKTTSFCDYLNQFWDFEKSEYFREQETMGKEPQPEYANEMQRAVKRYYQPYFQNKLLCQIDGNELQKFIVYLKIDKNLAASTVNSARNTAIKALRYAVRMKYIRHFDFDNVLRAGGKSKERGVLTRDEADKLFKLEWSCQKSRIAALIAYHTGMRLGEIRALKVCNIHENRIYVQFSWSSKKNRQKCTKNGEASNIPILPYLNNEIMTYIRQSKLYKLDSLLFPGKKPEIPFDSVQIRKNFQKMLELIGIDDITRKKRGICIHSFRHLLAKNLVENGVDIEIGKKLLRQRTDSVFLHYSAHVDKETFSHMEKALETVRQQNTLKEPIPVRGVV